MITNDPDESIYYLARSYFGKRCRDKLSILFDLIMYASGQ